MCAGSFPRTMIALMMLLSLMVMVMMTVMVMMIKLPTVLGMTVMIASDDDHDVMKTTTGDSFDFNIGCGTGSACIAVHRGSMQATS